MNYTRSVPAIHLRGVRADLRSARWGFLVTFMLRYCVLHCLLVASCAVAAPMELVAPSALEPNTSPDSTRAEALFAGAREAAEAGRAAEAFRLAGEALAHDPDHAEARRVLGYTRTGDGWTTPYGARMARRGLVWDGRYGWIKPDDLPRYEAGERPLGSKWISKEDDAARHATIERGWQVQSDHWLVTTNDSLEAAAGLSQELEALLDVWRALFADFNTDRREAAALFAGDRGPRAWRRPMKLVYHRDKQGYVAALRSRQPRIDETIGIYFDNLRESHFANLDQRGGELARATLYHEATHQLFQECQPTAKEIGRLGNFWATEGVALYMESLRGSGDRYTLGGPDAGRLPAARQRLAEGYYVPFAELAALGKRDLQRRTDLPPLYSQMAGLAAYLMEAEEGALRPAFVEHLRAVYNGEDDPQDLPRRLGREAQQLDSGYRRWVQSLPEATADANLQGSGGDGAEPRP
ncbi:hypothetical protein [Pirellulimonas nuda]|uniref:hypothetical protein n=1 Tax=Pirellulimonas nuda TaxID=2528009 RepID=UPI0011A6CA35|nr:hypothetical protein [Pirellulimonas nuda]